MKRWICVLLCFLLLAGCSAERGPAEEGFPVYYRSADGESRSILLTSEQTLEKTDYQAIFQALKTSPAEELMVSLIPADTKLEKAYLEGGVLYLEVSPEYSTLTGVTLTLANSCITLTYCQINGVSGVAISCDGESMSDPAILTPSRFMRSGGGGDAGVITAELYYPLKTGGMGYYTQSISVEENRSAPEAILYQLALEPVDRELNSFLPSELTDVTVWTEEDICYINLTSELVETMEGGEIPLADKLQCITNSICSLNSVSAVQFLQDGAVIEQWKSIGGDFPLTPKTEGAVKIDTSD